MMLFIRNDRGSVNPFVVFLILVPLLVALGLWGAAIWWSTTYGLTGGPIAMILIFGGLVIALIYLLVRTSKGPMLSDKELEHAGIADRRRLTNWTVTMTYFVLFVFLMLHVGNYLPAIRGWLGAISLVMALAMTGSAVWELRYARIEKRDRPDLVDLSDSEERKSRLIRVAWTRRALIVPSVITTCLISILFLRFEGDRVISSFDFVALIILLASFVFWLNMKLKNIPH